MYGIKLKLEPACHPPIPSNGLKTHNPRTAPPLGFVFSFPMPLLSYPEFPLVGFPRFLFLSSFSFVYHFEISDGVLPLLSHSPFAFCLYLELCISSFLRPGLHFLLRPLQPGSRDRCSYTGQPTATSDQGRSPCGFHRGRFEILPADLDLGYLIKDLVMSLYGVGMGSTQVPCRAFQQRRLQAS